MSAPTRCIACKRPNAHELDGGLCVYAREMPLPLRRGCRSRFMRFGFKALGQEFWEFAYRGDEPKRLALLDSWLGLGCP